MPRRREPGEGALPGAPSGTEQRLQAKNAMERELAEEAERLRLADAGGFDHRTLVDQFAEVRVPTPEEVLGGTARMHAMLTALGQAVMCDAVMSLEKKIRHMTSIASTAGNITPKALQDAYLAIKQQNGGTHGTPASSADRNPARGRAAGGGAGNGAAGPARGAAGAATQ